MENNIRPNQNDDIEKKLEKEVEKTETFSTATQHEEKFIGRVEVGREYEFSDAILNENGYKNIPLESLPSKGLFYPDGMKIGIRAASVSEIRSWSAVDENDYISIDEGINTILEKCTLVRIPGNNLYKTSYLDLSDVDRLFILFAIREYTFINGENKIYYTADDGEKIEIRKENLKYFEIPEKLMKHYNSEKKCFVFRPKGEDEDIHFYIPTIGVTQKIKKIVLDKQKKGETIDTAFVKFAPFIFQHYRFIDEQKFKKAQQESLKWSLKKISLYTTIIDMIANTIQEPKLKINHGGRELEVPLQFQGGIRSLFLISDIFDELE